MRACKTSLSCYRVLCLFAGCWLLAALMAAGCSDGCVLQARRIARVRPFNTGEWLGRWHHAVRLGGAVRQLEASQALRLVLRKQQAGLDELARECTEAAEARDAAESALVDAQAQ